MPHGGSLMDSVHIERAAAADAKEILALMKIIGGESDNLSFDSSGLPVTEEEEQAFLAGIEHSSREAFFVARKNEEIVGTAHYTVFPKARMSHRGTIGICLRKSACGQGIGTMLMQTLLDFAKHTAHSEIVSLEVRSDNAGAIRLYKKFGFEKIGCFKGFFKINGSLINFDIMEKFL